MAPYAAVNNVVVFFSLEKPPYRHAEIAQDVW